MRASIGIWIGMAALDSLATLPTLAQKAVKAGSGGKSMNEFEVSPLETRVLGQRNWLRGGPAALRVIVTNHMTGKPVKAEVTILAAPSLNGAISAYPISLYSGKTNSVGSLDAAFTSPSFEVGAFQLVVNVTTALGNDSVKEMIQLAEPSQLLQITSIQQVDGHVGVVSHIQATLRFVAGKIDGHGSPGDRGVGVFADELLGDEAALAGLAGRIAARLAQIGTVLIEHLNAIVAAVADINLAVIG